MDGSIQIGRIRLQRREAIHRGAAVLLLIRDGLAGDWSSLCKSLGVERYPTAMSMLRDTLGALEQAGLVVLEHSSGGRYQNDRRIQLADSWDKIQTAIGIGLTDLARFDQHRSMVVTPLFGSLGGAATSFDVFVLMPFVDEMRPVYDDHIASVASALNLTVGRADNFFKTGSIIKDICDAIATARIIVADCTGRNPNVFYEIGIAHTLGKPVVLRSQKRDDVPFDVHHLRYVQYDFTPRGMRAMESTLREVFINELEIEESGP
jgi:hypothetical protein